MRIFIVMVFVVCFLSAGTLYAGTEQTQRMAQFSNKKVRVWKTIIYPYFKQTLAMHRHDHDRVLVALTNGSLKTRDNKGNIHYLTLKKDTAYYLTKDPENEFHTDENMSHYPIKVMVIELNN